MRSPERQGRVHDDEVPACRRYAPETGIEPMGTWVRARLACQHTTRDCRPHALALRTTLAGFGAALASEHLQEFKVSDV